MYRPINEKNTKGGNSYVLSPVFGYLEPTHIQEYNLAEFPVLSLKGVGTSYRSKSAVEELF